MNLKHLPCLLMTCWLTDFFSNLDSGLDSVPGLRKIAAAEVIHLFSFLFLLFIFDHSLSVPLLTAAVSAELIVSKGLIDYLTQLTFFFPLNLAFFMNFLVVVFTFYFSILKLVLPQTLAVNYN